MVNKIENCRSEYCNHVQPGELIAKAAPVRPFAADTLGGNGEVKGQAQGQVKGWCDYFYELYVDCYTWGKTRYLWFKGWLGLAPKLAIPAEHPSKRPIEELTDLGGLLWARTLNHLFCLLSNKHRHVHAQTDFIYKAVPPHALDARMLKMAPPHATLVFIPLMITYPNGNNHYTIVTVDRARRTVEYNDSEGNCIGQPFLDAVKKFYFGGDPNAKILINKARAQWDLHSCGIHVMDYAHRRAKGESFRKVTQNPTSTWEIEDLRIQFAKDLLYANPWIIQKLRML